MKLSEYLKGKRGRGAQIARAMGIAPQQLYQWASGARPIPSGHCPDIEEQTEVAKFAGIESCRYHLLHSSGNTACLAVPSKDRAAFLFPRPQCTS